MKDVNSYQSSGKKFNNERGIISLTSWKARIGTVGKTLYSLLKMCPGFHIVLVLSEEEFPEKEKELPEELMLFVDNDLIEILWVYKNYKAFKKVIFTMDKYRDVPVISADDDCIYLKNYAQEFYDIWENNKDCFISCWGKKYENPENKLKQTTNTAGAATLFPPFVFREFAIKNLTNKLMNKTGQDDLYYLCLKMKMEINGVIICGSYKNTYVFHDENEPIHNEYKSLKKDEKSELIKNIYNLLDV